MYNNLSRWARGRRSVAVLVMASAGCVVGAGCGRPAATPARGPDRAAGGKAAEATPVADGAQQRAQGAWCAYLDLLYRRATHRDAPWSHRDECLRQTSTASPEMLERTASCARRALEGFDGDPLTNEYAAEVRRCGSEALDASALSGPVLDPFLSALCRRAEVCDATPYTECRAAIVPIVASRLGRAIGAVNERSRARIRACFAEADCGSSLGDRLSGCVDPVMERLLWLPPDADR